MEAEAGVNESIRYAFQNHMDSLNTVPKWWREFKTNAFESYANMPMPRRNDENWRFANRNNLSLGKFQFDGDSVPANDSSLVEQSRFTGTQAGGYVIADNEIVAGKPGSQRADRPRGYLVTFERGNRRA